MSNFRTIDRQTGFPSPMPATDFHLTSSGCVHFGRPAENCSNFGTQGKCCGLLPVNLTGQNGYERRKKSKGGRGGRDRDRDARYPSYSTQIYKCEK
jgi:hypothetical protein